jgi:hypothetical protein
MPRSGEDIENWLKFCPFCRKEMEVHPFSGNKACFVHGDFLVNERQSGEIVVEFKLMPFNHQPEVI